jgi:hypothetical protein
MMWKIMYRNSRHGDTWMELFDPSQPRDFVHNTDTPCLLKAKWWVQYFESEGRPCREYKILRREGS